MKPYLFLVIVFIPLFFSCGQRSPAAPAVRDTVRIGPNVVIGETDEAGYPIKYIEHGRLDEPNQVIVLTSRFAVVDGKVDGQSRYSASTTYFVHIDKSTGKADTVEADLEGLDAGDRCIIRDLTDSLQLKTFIAQVVTTAEDIYYNNSFLTWQDGKIRELFSLMDTREKGVRLRREGGKLIGFISGRDEVVDNVEEDYPVEIDTVTWAVVDVKPERQMIDWPTTVSESFRAHRVIGGQTDSSLIVVKAGAEVRVDTLYRALGKVRVRLADSTEVEIRVETAKQKLGHNGAG